MKTRTLSVLAATLFAFAAAPLVGCATPSDSEQDESLVTADQELARVGGNGGIAFDAEGAFFVFDNALYRVSKDGTKVRLADAPDNADAIALTSRYVVLLVDEFRAQSITFYDRANGYSSKNFPAGERVIELQPLSPNEVVATTLGEGLVSFSASGTRKVVAPSTDNIRDLKPSGTAGVYYGIRSRYTNQVETGELCEFDTKKGTTRVVVPLQEGSFTYVFDQETKTFFTERRHRTLLNGSVLQILDLDGKVLSSLEKPLEDIGAVAVNHDAFYLAARTGARGGGSWKLVAFDKATLAPTERGRMEPSVYRMAVDGSDLFYVHGKGAASPLRVRPL